MIDCADLLAASSLGLPEIVGIVIAGVSILAILLVIIVISEWLVNSLIVHTVVSGRGQSSAAPGHNKHLIMRTSVSGWRLPSVSG